MFTQMKLYRKIIVGVLLTVTMVIVSCTDAEVPVSSEVTGENFFQNETEFVSAMGDAYTVLGPEGLGGHNGFSSIQEVSTDEFVIPQRGQDWFDGGIWLRMHRHSFTYEEGYFNNTWQFLFSGVNNTNRLIFQFESAVEAGNADPELAEAFIAELRALRALYYYWLLDTFGNVPIITSFEDAPEEPSQPSSDFQEGRTQLFECVEQELLNALDEVDEDVGGTYGRMNRWVVHFVLAKLYLNSEVYTGTPRWEDAITHTDEIINSGNYNLSAVYRDNFVTDNSGSPEIIFAVPYDRVFLQGFNIHHMSLHYGSQSTFRLQEQPWNGYATVEEFYRSYIDEEGNPGPQGPVIGSMGEETTGTTDDRLSNFLAGPQFDTQGNRIEDDAVFSDFDQDGAPLTFTPEINSLEPNACRQCGVRVGKYEIEPGSTSNLDNDFVVFRYADVLLTQAEARWRLNNNDPEALRLVNLVRERAGVDSFTSLDEDLILEERGREFFYELLRRQDLIRFQGNEGETRFNDPWWEKDVSDPTRNVFPIPREQLEANDNLVQNPGYQGRQG